MVMGTPIPREQRPMIANHLAQNLAGPVAIEVWTQQPSALVRTDRDPCTFCSDVMTAARQLASLHPLLSLTRYDLDRHADRAQEAGIERPPVTVIRGGNGAEFRVTGMWSGLLFPAFVDAILFFGSGVAPIDPATREVLAGINRDIEVELLIAPYDPYSAHTLRVAAALAVECRRLHLEAVEIAEFPLMAQARMIQHVPLTTINGQRFPGAWDEQPLAEQLSRAAAGNTEAVIREHVLTSPFLTVEQALAMAEQEGQGGALPPTMPGPGDEPPSPGTSPGGLIIPGR